MRADSRTEFRSAIIDIGSNSIRLVAYAGARRAPAVVFNEKVMAGLGRSLSATGAIDARAFDRGVAALARFRTLCREMRLDDVRCVATAAVREASNGPDFLAAARALGLSVRLLSGADEARASGQGVLSSMPDADGIVADLGGGSLELVRVAAGATHHASSFPLGVLRLPSLRQGRDADGFARTVAAMLVDQGWTDALAGLPLYLVGGSWRSLARVEMTLADHPLPIMHHHDIPLATGRGLAKAIAAMDPARLAAIPGLSSSRRAALDDAATLLAVLIRALGSSRLIVSSSGLREGLLYEALPESLRAEDPLLAAVEEEGARYARFSANGRLINAWIAPLFADESALAHKLRLAACLLSDVAWSANPDFRADHGLEAALHGNWGGIDITGRVVMGQALFTCYSGNASPFGTMPASVDPGDIRQAIRWGLAMRLAQRLSGGIADPLHRSILSSDAERIVLTLPDDLADLDGETVQRRLRALAKAIDRDVAVRIA